MKKVLSQNMFTAIFTCLVLIVISFGGISPSFAEGNDGRSCSHDKGKKFERMDTNADGVITLEEVLAKAEKSFVKMDADGDGKVTKEEAKNYFAAKKEKHKGQYHKKQENKSQE